MKTPEQQLQEHRFWLLTVQVVRTEQGLNHPPTAQMLEMRRCRMEHICYHCKQPLGQILFCRVCGAKA